jgi:site-specific DNA recombinase
MTTNQIRHVAVYLRRSRDEEGKGIDEVLKVHEATLKDLCKQNKWSYELYREIASSSSIEGRPEMTKLLERIKEYRYDAVVVMDIDRLSRNEYDASDIKRVLHETETIIVTPTRNYDLQNDDDSLLVNIGGLIANMEYKAIHRRMRRGKRYLQASGCFTDGRPPLGYSRDSKTKKLVPNDRADCVKFIFDAIIKGMTVPEIILRLNDMGKRTRDGFSFRYNSILRIVNNESYKGTVISNRYKGRYDERPMSEWIIVENCHPPIVDEETWEKANSIISEYGFKAPRANNKTYPTSNLIYCAGCGRIQGCNKHTRGRIYVKHCACGNRSARYEKVLEMIMQEVFKHKHGLMRALLAAQTGMGIDNTQDEAESLRGRIKKGERALEKLQIQWEEDELDLPTFRHRKQARENEIAELELRLSKVAKKDNKIERLGLHLRLLSLLQDEWDLWDDTKINKALHQLISGILYSRGKDSEPKIRVVFKELYLSTTDTLRETKSKIYTVQDYDEFRDNQKVL